MINIKSDREVDIMRQAGKILAEVHLEMEEFIKPGISTYELDQKGLKVIKKYNSKPSFYKLYDFPANFCISVNEEIIHGIPDKSKIIKDGDVVKIDGGVCFRGFHSDAARTHIVGKVTDDIKLFVDRTKESFFEGIKACIIGNHINDIGTNIEKYIKQFNYGILEDYTGHGIGSSLHEKPDIYNYKKKSKGPKLEKNMTLAIEPMITFGSNEVELDDNDWTVRTVDKSMTAHYENTVLITENGPEILTLL